MTPLLIAGYVAGALVTAEIVRRNAPEPANPETDLGTSLAQMGFVGMVVLAWPAIWAAALPFLVTTAIGGAVIRHRRKPTS